MIRPIHSQSTCLARSYSIWRWHTCARNSQTTGTNHHNGRDLTKIIRRMSAREPNQTDRNIEMSRQNQPTLGRNTRVQTPPFANSP
jgi:hypothetical protein